VSGALELGHELVEELVDLVHLVAAEGGLEPDPLDLLGSEGGQVVAAGGGGAVAEADQVLGGPFQEAADLAGAVAADDSGEGPRPDLLGREPAFGHAASPLWLWAVMRAAACTLTRSIGKREPAAHRRGSSGSQPAEEVRQVRRAAAILALVGLWAVLAAGCAGDGDDEGAAAATAAEASEATATTGTGGDRRGGGAGDGDTDDVRIVSFAFAPATVRAKVGQKVKWEHQDPGVTHTVAALDGSFRSGRLHEGDEFSHLFTRAGSFAYRCTLHASMRGTVKVSG
jgi:plastocyanin